MVSTLSVLIRDGLEYDIPSCLALDHTYETEYVWQLTSFEEPGQWEITFKRERLPRVVENVYPSEALRLEVCLPDDQCFLVAADRETGEPLAYLTMRQDPAHQAALIHDILVARPYRGNGVGTRLLGVARAWARERSLTQLTVMLQTKNVPGIGFALQAGFTFCGFNDRHYRNRDIAVYFSQSLR